ncbi:SDR family oxidoreductase [Bradyrhizobium sp. NAS96.2]|uniref:SDR family oxidoreductase n=1 Tax=Bradyrhizobium sp. NAS96.2 TaxID=1680160 RepID=UPI00093C6781|nr:SDR family oxidoreductase [Bradyrhizobium sp. NAS96.2]OKO80207.1 short-chain dehydrogenase [Bradyrhizobium sp. NAS96.2]
MTGTKSILVIGGSSDIGHATALRYAREGWRVTLAARDLEAAQRNADDIRTRSGVVTTVQSLDVLQTAQLAGFVAGLSVLPDTVVCVVGELGDQQRAQTDPELATTIMRTNFEAPSLLLEQFAQRFEARGSGTIIGVSSVAGDRGRASNYYYGAAKAGFSQFLSGLRNRLALAGKVRVITVKPGFVRTRMTAHMKLPAHLTVDPDRVAEDIYLADVTRPRDVIYVARRFQLVMTIICALPEAIFKRMRI